MTGDRLHVDSRAREILCKGACHEKLREALLYNRRKKNAFVFYLVPHKYFITDSCLEQMIQDLEPRPVVLNLPNAEIL